MKRKVLLIVVSVVLLLQFIRPAQNNYTTKSTQDISKQFDVPDDIGAILQKSCFDCHSNATSYPWYTNVQPLGWWMASHVKEGKDELNFSEFGTYSKRKQSSKLKAIKNSIGDNVMPLPSYASMHQEARLSESEKEKITKWINGIQDSLSRR